MAAFRSVCVVAALVVCNPISPAKEKPWTEVKSPHFRVLTDGSVGDARRIANEFEQMRAVFATAFPKMQLETGAPLLIFAPRDEQSMISLAPLIWKKEAAHVAGIFQTGWDKQFAIVRIDQDHPGAYQVVYHEYVHSLLHANFRWLPRWLDEGLADFYGGTRFESTKVYLGAPVQRVRHLQGATLIPVEKMLTVNPYAEYKKDDRQIDVYYAEAWAMVHYLTLGDGMEAGKKISEFYHKLQTGEEQKQAFTEAFGSFDQVQEKLSSYVHNFAFKSYVMNAPETVDEKSFTARVTTVGETCASIGSYRLLARDRAEAREIIDEGLKEDPNVAELHENLAFLDFGEGRDSEASLEFNRAVELDKQRYLSLFYRAMMSPEAHMNSQQDCDQLESDLSEVIGINPKYAPAFVQLSLLKVREDNLSSGLAIARKAEQLEPSRAGYHLLSGRILLRQGKGKEAAQYARFVAERWHGPDHNEAVELWDAVPAEQREADSVNMEPVKMEVESTPGVSVTEGIVRQTICGGKERPGTVTLESQGKIMTVRAHGGFTVGFPDTLWYGEDHFSSCHHLEGLRAVVRYKASEDKQFDGDIVSVEYREDLPAGLGAKPATTQATPGVVATPK